MMCPTVVASASGPMRLAHLRTVRLAVGQFWRRAQSATRFWMMAGALVGSWPVWSWNGCRVCMAIGHVSGVSRRVSGAAHRACEICFLSGVSKLVWSALCLSDTLQSMGRNPDG